MDTQTLDGYIRQEIRKAVYPDRVELYLPFFFMNGSAEPLCLTFDRNGVLTDGGRTMKELKKRLGDLSPYQANIQNILTDYDPVTLEGGQKLTLRHFQTIHRGEESYLDYMGGLNWLLRVISLLDVVDTIEVDEDGGVRYAK